MSEYTNVTDTQTNGTDTVQFTNITDTLCRQRNAISGTELDPLDLLGAGDHTSFQSVSWFRK